MTCLQNSSGLLPDVMFEGLEPVVGAPVARINSSRFCPGFYVSRSQDIVTNVKVKKYVYIVVGSLINHICFTVKYLIVFK